MALAWRTRQAARWPARAHTWILRVSLAIGQQPPVDGTADNAASVQSADETFDALVAQY